MQRPVEPYPIRRVLVSGASGFIGARLAEALRAAGVAVTSIGRNGPASASHIAAGPAPWSAGTWQSAIAAAGADAVIHFAGVRSASIAEMESVNVGLARSLVEALQRAGRPVDLVVAGSAAECGAAIADGVPVMEDIACEPVSDYARTKLMQTQLALDYGSQTGARVLVTRIFNPLGPGIPAHLALGSFARQIAAAPRHGGSIITGNLDVWRDQIGVDQAAQLLARLALDRRAAGIVNVCSGVAYGMRAMLDEMIALSGKKIAVSANPDLLRGCEPRVIVGSVQRLERLCGRLPRQDLTALLDSTLAQERRRAEMKAECRLHEAC